MKKHKKKLKLRSRSKKLFKNKLMKRRNMLINKRRL